MPSLTNTLFRIVKRISSSIAFYPVVIATGFLITAGLVLAFESTSVAEGLRDDLPPGLTEADNAREILGTLITAIISLTVFSFSMVMVVLNGAAARLSPRVLPGLISDRRNQVILGFYLGSVLYYLLMIGTLNKNDPASIPTLGLLFALLFGFGCMALFVVFIRSVSQSIQVDWVIGQLHEGSFHNLQARKKRLAKVSEIPDASDWWCLPASRPGYLREVNERRLCQVLRKRDLVGVIQVEPGFFLIEGHPLLRLSAPLSDKDAEEVLDCFDFRNNEFASANVSYGMRQISEIAVKAISPAINDPGTAIRAVNLLGLMLKRLGGVPPFDVGCFDEGRPRLFYPQLDMQRLLELVIAPVRVYGSHDPLVLITLMQCMKNALHDSPSDEQLEAYHGELHALREEAEAKVENRLDRGAVNDQIERLNKLEGRKNPHLEPLSIKAR